MSETRYWNFGGMPVRFELTSREGLHVIAYRGTPPRFEQDSTLRRAILHSRTNDAEEITADQYYALIEAVH